MTNNAYILHRRPYQDNRVLLELFCENIGRVSGAMYLNRRNRNTVQPFARCEVSISGKHELRTLSNLEVVDAPLQLKHTALYSALYLNELLIRVLAKEYPHPYLFSCYQQTLFALQDHALDQQKTTIEAALRQFELRVLSELGYGLSFADDDQGREISRENHYHYWPERGFVCAHVADEQTYSGLVLQAMQRDQWSDVQVLQAAKRLMRHALHPLLGNKPLKSRELFRDLSLSAK